MMTTESERVPDDHDMLIQPTAICLLKIRRNGRICYVHPGFWWRAVLAVTLGCLLYDAAALGAYYFWLWAGPP
jgi:hypothetical protein